MQLLFKNTKVHFTVLGKGKAIVLLHGFLETSFMWNFIAENLSKNYKIICIDLLGHGNTENYGYIHTMEDQAKMVYAVLRSLKLRKYSVIGHSMGGYVALELANLVPNNINGLCLLNSTALSDSDEKKANRDRAIEAVKENKQTFVRLAIPMLFAEENRSKFKTEIKEITKVAQDLSVQGICAALEGMKIRKNNTGIYQSATFPIQMVIGKQDPALDYNSLLNQVKNTNVEVVEFPDGHMSYIENKIALLENLTRFVKK